MITFFIGLTVLLVGGFFYSFACEKFFKPDDNKITPAFSKQDGVDFVPMPTWKNCLIQLLNIAGTGPVLGAIQGILFGPIAFLTIPIGCILGGALHDYMSGMISVRHGGKQMPALIKDFFGKGTYTIYNVFLCFLLFLVGAVFIYVPGDLFTEKVLNAPTTNDSTWLWVVYAVIFIYYLIATLFPIDKIIGKIYPIFGFILILSAVGLFISLFFTGFDLTEIWEVGLLTNCHPQGFNFIPVFFVTVACGIVSGFHSTQSTIIARTLKKETDGKKIFYFMMILEGCIAMIWSAAAMKIFNTGVASTDTSATSVVGIISENLLGSVGGIVAVLGVVVLAITSGDTALRSLRMIIADTFHIPQTKIKNRIILSLLIFALVYGLLIFAKYSSDAFAILWRYFAWANQVIAVFTFALITVYLRYKTKFFVMALIPGTFYMFVVSSYILNATIGFNLPWNISYIIAGVFSLAYVVTLLYVAKKRADKKADKKLPEKSLTK